MERLIRPTVIAIAQAFKETLSAPEVAEAYRLGIRAAGAEPRVFLGSDGGDGLLDALGNALGRRTRHRTTGPLGDPLDVEVGWLDGRTAVVESRLVCGLSTVPAQRRDPERATTRGLGTLIDALGDAGANRVYVGLGGSATMDGGLGMARAWSWVARGDQQVPLPDGGAALETLVSLAPGRRPAATVVALADVRHPLLGPQGAVRFAAQKGADRSAADRLAAGLERLVSATAAWGGPEAARRNGAGAAGGLGFGVLVFAGGELLPGAEWMLDRLGFAEALDRASLLVVGEGGFDETSLAGKLSGAVLRAAASAGVRAGLLAPTARAVPSGVVVQSGGGTWDGVALARRTEALVRAALRLPPS